MPDVDKAGAKRRFERIEIAAKTQILVLDQKGNKVGVVRQLARGGFAMEPEKPYERDNKVYRFVIYEPSEEIRVEVSARVRYAEANLVGFEFASLTPDAAVDIGFIIGKYYEQSKT